jgi:hypothetical protein
MLLGKTKEEDCMKQIRDSVKKWPPPSGCWSGFYTRGNKLSPNLKTATIKDISVIKGDIHLSIVSDGREFSALLNALDASDTNRIVEVLSRAVGMLLDDAGKLDV